MDFKTARKWRIYAPPKKAAKYVIEGPVGLIKALSVEEGDLINWMPTEEREKAVPVKSLIPGKINLNGSKNSIAMVESVKEAKAKEI